MMEMDSRLQSVFDLYQRRRDEERARGHGAPMVDEEGREQRMLAIGSQAGTLLNILARSLQAPRILELGTSFGYSGLWLADGARASGGHVVSIEVAEHKSRYARERAQEAGLSEWIDHRIGDAVGMIAELEGPFDLVFVDLWKDLYLPCLEAFAPKLAPGAIVIADNMIRPGSDGIKAYADRIRDMDGMTSVLLPVGSGMEVSRYRAEK